jgi:hypothetical protein
MIDALNKLAQYLTFDTEDDFYYLQILQRRKDNPGLNSDTRVIKNYYIGSLQYLEKHYEEIKNACNTFNARAMLRLNRRSYEKVAFRAMQLMAMSLGNREYQYVRRIYSRACGQTHNDPNPKWILDIDNNKESPSPDLLSYILFSKPAGEKHITTLETKNGFHCITKPFDMTDFGKKFPSVSVHKDNPVNLYIP